MTTETLNVPQIKYSRILQATLLAALIAGAINVVLFLIGSALGQFPATLVIPASGQGISVGPVIVMSAFGAIGGGIVYAILGKLTKNPVKWFRIIAVIALVLSFGSPFVFANAPLGFYLFLEAMHIVAAAATVLVLTTIAADVP